MKADPISNLRPKELVALARFCHAAMLILNARLFAALALVLTAAAFGYALWQPDYLRLAAATIFGLLVFLPCLRLNAPQPVQQATEAENG